MKTKSLLIAGMLFLSAIGLFDPPSASAQRPVQRIGNKEIKTGIWNGQQIEYVDKEIAIKLRPNAQRSQVDVALNQLNARATQQYDNIGWGLIELTGSGDIMPVIQQLQQMSFVEAAEPNGVTREATEPNDPYFVGTSPATYPAQWGLRNTGQTPPTGTASADISAVRAWDVTTGSSNVVVAILDSGIPMLNGSLSHPDLDDPNKIILGPDYIDLNQANGVKDERGHGTHVAGIVGAETDNGVGIAGVAWGCKLLIIQVFDAYGYGTDQSFYNGVLYASDYKTSHEGTGMVINYSGGGVAGSQRYRDAIAYAQARSVTIVCSAGNAYGGVVTYPALYSPEYSNVIAVSSTDFNDVFSTFSSRGSAVNVSAPGGTGVYLDGTTYRYNGSQNLGGNILSTTPGYSFTLQTDPVYPGDPYDSDVANWYGYLAGTSMAAPLVSGVVALCLSRNLSLPPITIRNEIIQPFADDKGTPGRDDYYGYGRINALRALAMANGQPLAPANPGVTAYLVSTNPKRFVPKLTWVANSEPDLDSYKIYRKISPYESAFSLIATVAAPTTSFIDLQFNTGSGATAIYKIKAVDAAPLESPFSNTVSIDIDYLNKPVVTIANGPSAYRLIDAYPNPFNPSTQINYDLPENGNVSLVVYDVLGRMVAELESGYREAGYHSATWNASNQASGVYFARFSVINSDGKIAYAKMNQLMLIR